MDPRSRGGSQNVFSTGDCTLSCVCSSTLAFELRRRCAVCICYRSRSAFHVSVGKSLDCLKGRSRGYSVKGVNLGKDRTARSQTKRPTWRRQSQRTSPQCATARQFQ